MLETLSLIFSKVSWLKPLVLMLGLACLVIFCSSLFNIGYYIEEVYLIPSLAGFIWSLLLFMMLSIFGNIPIRSDKKLRFFTKIKYWFVRLGYKILTVTFLLMTGAGLILSFRLFSVWIAN
jgi:hypothetical protein